MDFVFSINEVQEFSNSEKEKRFLRDNPPVVLDLKSDDETKPIISKSSETVSDEVSPKRNIKENLYQVMFSGRKALTALNNIAKFQADNVRLTINDQKFEPLSDDTARKKKSDIILIDTYSYIKQLEEEMGAAAMSTDNLHYTKECSEKIKDYVTQQINSASGAVSSATPSTGYSVGAIGDLYYFSSDSSEKTKGEYLIRQYSFEV